MVLIDSAPPARISGAWLPPLPLAPWRTPSRKRLTRVAASATASRPEAQLRWTVSAGTWWGTPAHSAATRAGLVASTGITTLPRITSSSRSALRLLR